MNCTSIPENATFIPLTEILSDNVSEKLYISAVGCQGIIRRSRERKIVLNSRLNRILLQTSKTMSVEEIERRSRVQKRGE